MISEHINLKKLKSKKNVDKSDTIQKVEESIENMII